jgi:hypothetical protein
MADASIFPPPPNFPLGRRDAGRVYCLRILEYHQDILNVSHLALGIPPQPNSPWRRRRAANGVYCLWTLGRYQYAYLDLKTSA